MSIVDVEEKCVWDVWIFVVFGMWEKVYGVILDVFELLVEIVFYDCVGVISYRVRRFGG